MDDKLKIIELQKLLDASREEVYALTEKAHQLQCVISYVLTGEPYELPPQGKEKSYVKEASRFNRLLRRVVRWYGEASDEDLND